MYERFLQKWFGVDPVRARDHRPADDPMVTIGAQLRAARTYASLTQSQVEELTGIDQTTISRLETGKGSAMRLDRFARILVAIDARIVPGEGSIPAWLAPVMLRDPAFDDEPEEDPNAVGDPEDDAERDPEGSAEDDADADPRGPDRGIGRDGGDRTARPQRMPATRIRGDMPATRIRGEW